MVMLRTASNLSYLGDVWIIGIHPKTGHLVELGKVVPLHPLRHSGVGLLTLAFRLRESVLPLLAGSGDVGLAGGERLLLALLPLGPVTLDGRPAGCDRHPG
jgi:hypothetical protein